MTVNLIKVWDFIKSHKPFILLSLFYFLFRIIYLTKLPIFNDEAIYLDWGYREIHVPGLLFFSLFDSKQPFLMWIYGILESILPDPLFAGRMVSVFTGFFTMLGLYKIVLFVWDKKDNVQKIAVLTALLYIVCPIFVFYDRQALMESSLSTIGVWAGYLLIKAVKSEQISSLRNLGSLLGILLGIGFFIKSSASLFLPYLLLTLLFKKKWYSVVWFFILFFAVTFLLFIQPAFWSTLNTNDRYVFTLTELLHFPFSTWLHTMHGNIEIMFFFLSPTIFISSILGIIVLLKNVKSSLREKAFTHITLILFFIVPIFLTVLLDRGPVQRPLVPYLPLACIFASVFLIYFFSIYKKIGVVQIIFTLIIPAVMSFYLVINPNQYILLMKNFSGYSQTEYVSGYTSGQEIAKVMDFIETVAKYHKIIITTADNTGNPESALRTYYDNNKKIPITYLDGRFMENDLDNADCLKSDRTILFVSRGEYLTNLNKYLDKMTEIHLSNGTDWIGIWTLKNPCSGRTLNLNFAQTN